jgi:hypothetical protein
MDPIRANFFWQGAEEKTQVPHGQVGNDDKQTTTNNNIAFCPKQVGVG